MAKLTLKKIDIIQFGVRIYTYSSLNVRTVYKVKYTYEKRYIFGITRTTEEELPILFDSEESAKDFIECGAKITGVPDEIRLNYSAHNIIFLGYICSVPVLGNEQIKIGFEKLDTKGDEQVFVVTSFDINDLSNPWYSINFSNSPFISKYIELRKRNIEKKIKKEEEEKKQKIKEENYLKSFDKIKSYVIKEIEQK